MNFNETIIVINFVITNIFYGSIISAIAFGINGLIISKTKFWNGFFGEYYNKLTKYFLFIALFCFPFILIIIPFINYLNK